MGICVSMKPPCLSHSSAHSAWGKKEKAALASDLSFRKILKCLLHHNLLHAHLRTSGEAQEVDALGYAAETDLRAAAGIAAGDPLSQAIKQLVAVGSLAALDVQLVVGGVGMDVELDFRLVHARRAAEAHDERRFHRADDGIRLVL